MARPRLTAASLAFVLAVVTLAACNRDTPDGTARPGPSSSSAPTTSIPDPDRPRGGTARVGVWGAPDVGAPTIGGAAVRALVLPQLFVAQPDGAWRPSLVEPGSDRTADDGRSASFRLRPRAAWSDGSPITAEDLRRNPDGRVVAGIDGPDVKGVITVRFSQPLPGWRRLWSGRDTVNAPGPNIWGGPFVVASATPGLETVLRRNDKWSGVVFKGPFLDEVRLVLVPDAVTAADLLAKGELDALMPPAYTVRTAELRGTAAVSVDAAQQGGWWVGLLMSAKLSEEDRRAMAGTIARERFISALMQDEAVVLNGFLGPEDAAWAVPRYPDARSLKGDNIDLVGQIEEPMSPALQRVMQQRVRTVSGTIELRNAEADRVEPWLAEGGYEAAVVMAVDGPEVCWLCRWQHVDEGLARAADAGDRAAAAQLEVKLRDQAWVVPFWRPRTVVAWRNGLNGMKANGYGLNAAWNAWEWWRTETGG
ncbi:MAG: glutathione transport system substrate-binding protein [Actinomycetota bacterium]